MRNDNEGNEKGVFLLGSPVGAGGFAGTECPPITGQAGAALVANDPLPVDDALDPLTSRFTNLDVASSKMIVGPSATLLFGVSCRRR